jgi:PAS domain S-box-containing protein
MPAARAAKRSVPKSSAVLRVPQREIEKLRSRLEEAEAIIEAIRTGEVEALVVNGPQGDQVFTLKGADHSYRVFVEVMSEGAVTLGENGVILYCNKRFAEMVKTPLEEVIGSFFKQYLPKQSHDEFDDMLRHAHGAAIKGEFDLRARSGSLVPASLSIARFEGDEMKSACLVATDMTEQKQSQERLLALSHRLLEVQERERRHLARELHDEVGQILTGLKITLETNCYLPGALPEQEAFQKARDQVEGLLKQIQDMSLDLRPAMLDDLGLLPALLWHFERYTRQTSIKVSFRHAGLHERRFSPEIETAAYRIVQEALTNVARHAGANEVDLYIHSGVKALVIQIEDNGNGFDVRSALASRASSGLTGMQERAGLLGGELLLNSALGKGTQLRATLPFALADPTK